MTQSLKQNTINSFLLWDAVLNGFSGGGGGFSSLTWKEERAKERLPRKRQPGLIALLKGLAGRRDAGRAAGGVLLLAPPPTSRERGSAALHAGIAEEVGESSDIKMAAVASKPNFAVVCSFLERYGASLELPEFTFPELEEALENKKSVPQPLVDLHLKLMRKIGKSVSFDRWEKYLLRICLEYNNTWAWEMEKIGYTEMDAECKLGLLKYLCECQFDDNLKFKNVLNEEEPDAMRIHPIGCDKDGLMYWYQLDQELNVRLYTEEQDDQDGTSWKLIVRDRNELAETLQLLKAQIDPALLSKFIQEGGSSRTSPTPEDEESKKELEEHLEEEMKLNKVLDEQQKESESIGKSSLASTSPVEDKKVQLVKKQEDDNGGNLEQMVKIEEPGSENIAKADGTKPTKENSVNKMSADGEDKPSKAELMNLKSSGERKVYSGKLTSVECEKLEVSVKVEPADDIKEKSSEELERALRNVKQAKLPVKKREIKLAEDYDKGPIGKPVTPVKELLKVEGEPVKQAPIEEDGKQLVNGEVTIGPQVNQHKSGEGITEASAPGKTEEPKGKQDTEAKHPVREEENGIDGPGTKSSEPPISIATENHGSVIKVEVNQNCVTKRKGGDPGLLELEKSTEEAKSKCENEDSSKCSVNTNLSERMLPDKKQADCIKGGQEECKKVSLRRTRSSMRQQAPEKAVAEETPQKVEHIEEKKPETEQGEARCLRRSQRISKPTIKVTENQEKKAIKKEEVPAPQSPRKEENQRKLEKDSSLSRGTKRKAKASRRAKWTKSKGWRRQDESSEESESDQDDDESDEAEEERPAEDDEPCKKCGLSNHPELILLCDSCDSGYHTACLRPPLMTIPDGEWFCPPCQHKFLCEKLEEQLQNIDVMIKKRERAERRKERLAFVGINVENIITPKDLVPEEPEIKDYKSLERRSGRTRRSINYRFDEFDDAIDEAIHEDIQEAEGKGAGRGKDMANITGQSHGKDISTILAESKENKRPSREAACRRKKRRRLNDLDSDSTPEDEESEEEFRISESSEEEFEISDRDSEAELASNDEDGFDSPRRGRHQKYTEPMRRSRRLRGRAVKRYSDEDEDEDEDEQEESDGSSCYSDVLDMRRRRSKRNQSKKVNYREDSESERSMKSSASRKERLRGHKRRLYITISDESSGSKSSEEEDDERPQRKRPNRIEDEEDEDQPALVSRLSSRPCRDCSKKPAYRLMSDEEEEDEELQEAEKDASSLDCSLVELPPSNGQTLISRTGHGASSTLDQHRWKACKEPAGFEPEVQCGCHYSTGRLLAMNQASSIHLCTQ
ncbi:remodeling and spacing factor 1 isoform X3 [Hypanus sabinus]|uniref:remodeling and spacing factor 1 isoform X3 n=1 Tax=Hypanus sabinus TaxID=79690 RepID=UPI0028C45C93|nr:remodeling and spacing factor 1 isoform X3 [Hypanus sabinus]